MSYRTTFTHVFLDSLNELLRLYLLKTPEADSKLIFIMPEVNWSAIISENEIDNLEGLLTDSLEWNGYTHYDKEKIISTIKELYKLSRR